MRKVYTSLSTFVLAISIALYNAVPVLAANPGDPAGGEGGFLCPDEGGFKVPGCGGEVKVGEIISSVISILLFGAFIIALLFLIFGGIKWIMSGGEKDGAAKAKETITSALIGLAVVLGSWLMLNVVVQVLTGSTFSSVTVPSLNIN